MDKNILAEKNDRQKSTFLIVGVKKMQKDPLVQDVAKPVS